MPNARKALTASAAFTALALGACSKEPADQNIAIETNSAAAPAEIETLPADESSATPSEDLADGSVDDNGAATTNQTNSF